MNTRLLLCRALLLCILLTAALGHAAPDQRGLAARPKAPTGEEARGDLWLLTIGINSYLSWPRLKTAVNDARAVKEVLLKRYHLDPARVVELTDEKATRQNILGAFRDLAKKVRPEDSLLVYYAGHGHIDGITGKGSWIPVESGADDPTNWLSNRDVTDYLNVNAIKAKHVLLVSDSCFSGDFFRGNRGGLPAIDDAMLRKAYTRSSRQAISSGGLEPVSDAGFGGNSVFSHFLVASLQNNSKPYLIPSELFGEIRSGVGKNAEQLPQFGDLHGTGGQEGGELILFLKGAAENRLNEMAGASAARQKELEQLKKAEQAAAIAKQKEQAELARKQAVLDTLDRQIAEMKGRLGSGAARSSDSLDAILAMVEQKEEQAIRLEELRRQKEAEEKKRQQEIARLKKEAIAKRAGQVKADIAKYQKIASSQYGQDMKGSAWDALVSSYPDAKAAPRYDIDAFMLAVGLTMPVTKDPVTGMEFVPVAGGCFQMGEGNERHEVCVSDFNIAKYEVTQGQWQRVMGSNPSSFKNGDRYPVENVSWNDAQDFIRKLNDMSSQNYRLPTEAEWEYAARSGGKDEKFAGFSDESQLYRYANFCDADCAYDWKTASQNDGYKETAPVGSYLPNGLGIHDMSGNVWEWVSDWYDSNYYKNSPKDNPQGAASGSARVSRGGCWNSGPAGVRAAFRLNYSPGTRGINLGFRLLAPVQ